MTQNSRERLNTSGLLQRLFKTTSFDRFLVENGESVTVPPLHVYLSDLCKKKGEVREHVILRGDIERTYGHQIFRGIRQPSRDKIIQLAFGFPLNTEETQALLKIACKPPLYPKIKRDAALLYGLSHGYTMPRTQDLLAQLGLTILGGCNE